jgi:hypothetical protein
MLAQTAMVDPMTELFQAIKSPTTKRKYELRMRQFVAQVFEDRDLGVPNRQGRAVSKPKEAEKQARAAKARAELDWATAMIDKFLGEIACALVAYVPKPNSGVLRQN